MNIEPIIALLAWALLLYQLPMFFVAMISVSKASKEIVFEQIPHDVPGQSRWKIIKDPLGWSKKSFNSTKNRTVFHDQTGFSVLLLVLFGACLVQAYANFNGNWITLAVSALSLVVLFFKHRWILISSDFSMAKLCDMRNQAWVADKVNRQDYIDFDDDDILLLAGEPGDSIG